MFCKISFEIKKLFIKFGWTFFNIQISQELANTIEKSGIIEGVLGRKIGNPMTHFIEHYLKSKGSSVRIRRDRS